MESVVKIICMYCEKDMGKKDGKGIEGETSSICRQCWEERLPGVPYPEEDKE